MDSNGKCWLIFVLLFAASGAFAEKGRGADKPVLTAQRIDASNAPLIEDDNVAPASSFVQWEPVSLAASAPQIVASKDELVAAKINLADAGIYALNDHGVLRWFAVDGPLCCRVRH
jgi:hypothetical protein